jgi:hypothetical protein
MDDIWWKLLMILNLLVLVAVVTIISDLKELLHQVSKALPAALNAQERIADKVAALELNLRMRDKTDDEIARELEWEARKERIRQRNHQSQVSPSR